MTLNYLINIYWTTICRWNKLLECNSTTTIHYSTEQCFSVDNYNKIQRKHRLRNFVTSQKTVHASLSYNLIKDVFWFIDCIKDLNTREETVISLDVIGLFANVPLMKGANYMCHQIFEMGTDIMNPVDVTKNLFVKQTMDMNIMFGEVVQKSE